jgi:Zn-dependent protease with chaperone function
MTAELRASTEQTICPVCGATIETVTGFVVWCEACDWNLKPSKAEAPTSFAATFYAAFGQRAGQSLFDEQRLASSLKPTLTPSRVAATLFALFIHLSTLAILAVGFYLVVTNWPYFFVEACGVVLIVVGLGMIPRVPKYPAKVASRDTYPALYEIAGKAAHAVGARPPHAIVLDLKFNASYSHAGWRRRQILTLGLPLLAVLDEEEIVALLGHEMAHGVNGDISYSFIVGSAVEALDRWYTLLTPTRQSVAMRRSGTASLATLLLRPVLMLLAQLPRGAGFVLMHLLWRDSQRAEYLADSLAAKAAGTAAVVSLLAKLQLSDLVQTAIQNVAMGSSKETLLLLLRARCAAMPSIEWKRLDRVGRMQQSRLDSTHPPTSQRIALLEARVVSQATLRVDAVTRQRFEGELAQADPPATQMLVEQYRDSLYAR